MKDTLIPRTHIRNFSIIAHIDHGKSTLADRFIQICGGLQQRDMTEQVLDTMDIERERGITIKSQSVALDYRAKDGELYRLNMIDTPGHVDFSYEVSRSLAACEGALLVVDATQGVEAQSVSTCYTAIEQNLVVLPVLNKMDLEIADPERVCREIEEIIGIDAQTASHISARSGEGVHELLEKIICSVRPPEGDYKAPLQALIIDSWFDRYLGVTVLVRVMQGTITRHDTLVAKSTDANFNTEQIGVFCPKREERDILRAGEVGYVVLGVKDIRSAPVGDTLVKDQATAILAGFKPAQRRVYAGLFPNDNERFEHFRESLQRLALNDPALYFEPENSHALGPGFRCGFLGMLHMEIIQERLDREYGLDLIVTAPTVVYEVECTDGKVLKIANPADLPMPSKIASMREPIVRVRILTPEEYVGKALELCVSRRGVQQNIRYLGGQVSIEFLLPMSEVVTNLFDRIKSISSGFASLEYSMSHFEASALVRLDVLLGGDCVDALSTIVHRTRAEARGRVLVEKMKNLIPRQMYDVPIQAAIGGRIIARQNVKALRKNVTAKCYGGDVTRKRKLLDKQKSGKKRMKRLGRIDLPQSAFMAVLADDTRAPVRR